LNILSSLLKGKRKIGFLALQENTSGSESPGTKIFWKNTQKIFELIFFWVKFLRDFELFSELEDHFQCFS